ncbi:MAG: HAD-IIA family hydrolase [Alkalilacustris sp.]
MTGAPGPVWTAARAFDRYEGLRAHLPAAGRAGAGVAVAHLGEVAERFDAFILDAFGVLNVGERPVPGAVERMRALRAAGKALVVLTNGAAHPRAAALAKYRRLGFDFTAPEVVASRDIAAAALAGWRDVRLWAAITAPGAGVDDLAAPGRCVRALEDDARLLHAAEGFLFLGSEGWTQARQAALIAALRAQPRPLVVANPDVVAPREHGLTLEPGHFAHEIAAATGQRPEFFGKPYANAFEAALARLPAGVPRHRVAMVGDTLHTDVLGAQAAGLGSVLITDHGLFAGQDPAPFMAASGLWPDVIARTT